MGAKREGANGVECTDGGYGEGGGAERGEGGVTCVPRRLIGCRSSLYFGTSSRGWALPFLFGGICEALEQRQRSVDRERVLGLWDE